MVMGLGGMGVGEGVGSMHLTALQNMEVRGGEDYRYFFSPFLLSQGFDEKKVLVKIVILIRTQITIDQSCDDISAVVILTSST